MVPLTQPATSAKKSHLRGVEEELAKFERCEREFMARERRERAAQLGLPIFWSLRRANRLSQTKDIVS
jgi:hypothetical protein